MKDLFNIPAAERRGMVTLMVLILLVNLGTYFYPMLFPGPAKPPAEELKFIAAFDFADSVESRNYKTPKSKRWNIPAEAFDPNNFLAEDWVKMGFTQKQALAIIRTQKKKPFRNKTDVKSLFCMPAELYRQIETLILITNFQESVSKPSAETRETKKPHILELNSADSLQILQLPGIGPYWTKRILRARNQWGGFCCIEQILTLKGFPDSIAQAFTRSVRIDTALIQKFNINTISWDDFSKHPAGWYGVAKSIVNYRDQHGDFHSAGEFSKIYSLKPERIEILRHYVKFE
ncbi:MAG: helix-hairpin-helix domain-containing protein [Bacteroidia bacterium]